MFRSMILVVLLAFMVTVNGAVPVLVLPANGSAQTVPVYFSWNYAGTASYEIQIWKPVSAFATIVYAYDSIVPSGTGGGAFKATKLQLDTIYYWHVRAIGDGSGYSPGSTFYTPSNGATHVPRMDTLLNPIDGSINVDLSPTLYWYSMDGAQFYYLQVSTDGAFMNLVVNDSSLSVPYKQIGPLSGSTRYYWRARAKNIYGSGPWPVQWGFTTKIGTSISNPTTSRNIVARNNANDVTTNVLGRVVSSKVLRAARFIINQGAKRLSLER
jgi:hypothetical protein